MAARKKVVPASVPEQPAMSLSDQVIALAQLPEAERIEALKAIDPRVWYVAVAQNDDGPDGFECFYKLVHGNNLPSHGRKWIEKLYEAHEAGRGFELFSWRGSWKSTTVSMTFGAFRIGKEPHKTNLVVGANDDSAEKVTAAIANTIELSLAWKMVFPNVEPYKAKGWGAEGYYVIDKQYTPEQWQEITSAKIDPTLVGGGYGSSRLPGKHPDGFLMLDDIHDEKNSASEKQRQEVIDIVSDTIIPTMVRNRKTHKLETWFVAIGTPWHEKDAYHFLKDTREYRFMSTPIMAKAEEGEEGAVYIDGVHPEGMVFKDLVGWWHLTWPKMFPPEVIISLRTIGKRAFSRMFLLDMEAAKVGGMAYQLYPAEAIDFTWRTNGGLDYASIRRGLESQQMKDRDSMALCYLSKVPTGGAVVGGGVEGKLTMVQSQEKVEAAQGIFKNWGVCGVEDTGKGETFVDTLLLKPHLRIMPIKTGNIEKHKRQETILGSLLELGILRISDANTPFLNVLRYALDNFPDGNDDVRDSLVCAVKTFPELFVLPSTEVSVPAVPKRRQASHPLQAFGNAGR